MSQQGKKGKKFSHQNQQQRHQQQKKVQIARKDPPPKQPEERKPMILLKPKERVEASEQDTAAQVTPAKPQHVVIAQPVKEEEQLIPEMTRPCELIFSNFDVSKKASDYLIDNNIFFKVIGVIGTKASGKSTILNFLARDRMKNKNLKIFPDFRDGKSGLKMFITSDRTILIDFQDAFANEADTIKMIMFALSLCHVVLVVQTGFLDVNLMRQLIFAEMMKFNKGNRLCPNGASVIFVKNRTTAADFAYENAKMWRNTLDRLFRDSNLNVFTECVDEIPKKASKNTIKSIKQINLLEFPDLKCKNYVNCIDLSRDVEELVCSVLKLLKNPQKIQPAFTEKMWWEIALNLSETHKTEYFLRKYDHLTNTIGSTTTSGGDSGKDRYALNYHVDS
ncbi:hypothetical protein DMENIID0001_024430 [Sergentomyia squamirostris]